MDKWMLKACPGAAAVPISSAFSALWLIRARHGPATACGMGRALELLQRLRHCAAEAKEMSNSWKHVDPDWRMPLESLEELLEELSPVAHGLSDSEKQQLCRDCLSLRLRPPERLASGPTSHEIPSKSRHFEDSLRCSSTFLAISM